MIQPAVHVEPKCYVNEHFSDTGARCIFEGLQFNNTLVNLSLNRTSITATNPDTARSLTTMLKINKSLTHLDLSSIDNVPADQIIQCSRRSQTVPLYFIWHYVIETYHIVMQIGHWNSIFLYKFWIFLALIFHWTHSWCNKIQQHI